MRRRSRKGRALRWLLAIGSLMALALLVGFFIFGFSLRDQPVDRTTRVDAVVVLTGGSGRLQEGVRLLREGMARMLLISGVNRQVTKAEILRLAGDPSQDLAERITLGYRAARTRDNASETAAWFNSRNFGSLRLVTANYHMPRALLELREAMPQATIIPHPVSPPSVSAGLWWRNRTGLVIIGKEYLKFLATWAMLLVS